MEPVGVGTRSAVPSSLPFSSGRTNPIARAAPVVLGMIDEVNEAFAKAAADTSYRGVLEYSEEQLVSADIVGNPASCIYSAIDTMANGRMVKVLGWYDNEWGYSNRLVDLVAFIGA